MARKKNAYIGKWRILEMELWDQVYVDEITEGHFTFEKGGLGYFQFGLVEGQIDYRIEKCGELERIEFSWEGHPLMGVRMARRRGHRGQQIQGGFPRHLRHQRHFGGFRASFQRHPASSGHRLRHRRSLLFQGW